MLGKFDGLLAKRSELVNLNAELRERMAVVANDVDVANASMPWSACSTRSATKARPSAGMERIPAASFVGVDRTAGLLRLRLRKTETFGGPLPLPAFVARPFRGPAQLVAYLGG